MLEKQIVRPTQNVHDINGVEYEPYKIFYFH